MIIQAKVKVNNMYEKAKPGYLVVRDFDGEVWYYGNYGTEERAETVAREIGNGFVVRYDGVKADES